MPTSTPPTTPTRRATTVLSVVVVCLAMAAVITFARWATRDVAIGDALGSGDVTVAVSPSEVPKAPVDPAPTLTDDGPASGAQPSGESSGSQAAEGSRADQAQPAAPVEDPTSRPADDAPSPQEDVGETDPASALWDRKFSSVSVSENGRPRTLLPGSELVVGFSQNQNGKFVSWYGGCNAAGASAEVSATHLRLLESQGNTGLPCGPAEQEQDMFLTRFLESGPSWELAGDRLTLRSGDTVIQFEESE